MTEEPGARPPRQRRRADRLLGGAAEPAAPRPARERPPAPAAVRRAALVVAVEAAALAGVALWLLYLTVASTPDSVGRAVAEVVYVGFFAALLGAAAVGLRRVSAWARGPVVVLQLLLGLFGYSSAFQAGRPLIGVPVLVLVALTLYLLLTPEARLAFLRR
ncbi:hypothetical protein DQ238_04775 [Geodermatophilus sp. TF02-6]|uniref:hypothetical protein n=1 Tax=Geodermatophilus sp. TF02-6 TaxID=2250575 RepID=UPI000DE9683F|nr:hypothetical protein [Geodermatophilus sp. TF02-6]RBY81953.1 hypothetical protein DQ238_04775 [Geodermatophilus sp. TF02-6]